jgi:hypothetical protein
MMLKDSHRLFQLHTKFWGKAAIVYEARKWHNSHTAVEVDREREMGPDCYAPDLGIKIVKITYEIYAKSAPFCVRITRPYSP